MKVQILAARPGPPAQCGVRQENQEKVTTSKRYQFTKTAGVIFDIEAIK